MSAREELRRVIEASGPISIAEFMSFSLTDPRYGYYATRDPFGAAGDFTTAPEISQMFGELIGLWTLATWRQMGNAGPLTIVELGPGRGTLMADALRAMAQSGQADVRVHLIETSAMLRERQRETLAKHADVTQWHDDVASLPQAPMIVIANEFFDALPIRQAVSRADGWHERLVGLDEGELTFGLAPYPLRGIEFPDAVRNAAPNSIFEWRDDRIVADLAHRVVRDGGAVLAIDYGHVRSAAGDTLQAMRAHAYDDVLAHPGEADLTAHVDFAALARAGASGGAKASRPIEQGEFLRRLGIDVRADRLKQSATREQSDAIDAAVARLTGSEPLQMGTLFKVLALSQPNLTLPVFDSA